MDKKRKHRTRKYLMELQNKAVRFYFDNPDKNSLQELSEIFNLNKERISKGISIELERRINNSMSRKFMRQ